MYFRIFLIVYFSLNTLLVWADEPTSQVAEYTLDATPNKCVALREGSNCYAIVTLHWQQPILGDYCLRNVESKKVMQCWLSQQEGSHTYEFNSAQTQHFELISTQTGQVHNQTEVLVNWVYTSKQKKRRWRLF
ncbi:DUF3019 domain-containing protein [Pseudoalteromonas tunicata]|jgi:hypothetical protein|uniref:Putative orphan protein putative signal peptide n=1 Tax=Pseudoalteromonas tunicata D2 TaxID=87626 RepID=A4CD68_9GAMM|nr:DUF3019 domain-containing protein [Pseudoalteromonas tunicata]ATC94018.1 hypothetical protein PTUN_a1382 [Pseudoalteromonas tunicata]AXT29801.1 DUF3019 domain-containing protein [Pseudoalteromonas tunicata]EAR27511.1 putative orphan protein; putative signal peptide [Pseudoalteromonas tunicata D2]MDP4984028.1 DUF3019 domain-containing protein [Pseudoalteromonas tunicata]MDP5213751.1 DUF3019 domain-containing protein [Pseudoalteromonas tunicata]